MIFVLLMLICPITALASTITVGPIGCNYTHIWEALDAANPGDVIEVENGTYYEKLIIDKPIILRGNNTIIDAGGLRSPIELISNGITLEGLIIVNSGDEKEDAGVKVGSNSNLILNNTIINNNYGIFLKSSSENVISGNSISRNSIKGIYLKESNKNYITKNHIFLHTRVMNYFSDDWMKDWCSDGIYFEYSDNNIVISNHIYENYCCGVRIKKSDNNFLLFNSIQKNHVGIFLGKEYQYPYDLSACSNVIAANYLVDNNKYNAYDKNNCNQWFTVLDNASVGNQYGDFDEPREGCRDVDKDGICDFAYEIPGGNAIDKYPITTHAESYFAEGTVLDSWQDSIKNKVIWTVPIPVPSNITALGVRLTWDDPNSDLSLLLFNETGHAVDVSYNGGDSLEENVRANNPAPGIWRAVVYAFHVREGESQEFKLEARVA